MKEEITQMEKYQQILNVHASSRKLVYPVSPLLIPGANDPGAPGVGYWVTYVTSARGQPASTVGDAPTYLFTAAS